MHPTPYVPPAPPAGSSANPAPGQSRRQFLHRAALAAAGAAVSPLVGRDWSGQDPIRYPDADIIALEQRFGRYMIGNAAIERLHTGARWAEGTAWSAVGRYVLWSDIPGNRQLRRLDEDGHVSVFREPSGNSNGNTFDFAGRQISCEHGNRRVVRYENDGTVTVLADKFDGKPFNAPNDVVVHPDGGIWFTDPGYGILVAYEGHLDKMEVKEAVYRIDPKTGKMDKVTDEIFKPIGLCFSPDYKKLYIADTGSSHYPNAPKNIKVWDVAKVNDEGFKPNGVCFSPDYAKLYIADTGSAPGSNAPKNILVCDLKDGTKLGPARVYAKMNLATPKGELNGGADGIRADTDGNIWAACGWAGAGYDGVHVFTPEGQRIGLIQLPEIPANLCFGGAKRNRLFIAASQSLYAVYVNAQGAHIT